MAFQARLCGPCCRRLLVSDVELAWKHGLEPPAASLPYIVRYVGDTRVRFFMRQHLRNRKHPIRLSREQVFAYTRRWPGLGPCHIQYLLDRMA